MKLDVEDIRRKIETYKEPGRGRVYDAVASRNLRPYFHTNATLSSEARVR